MDGYGDKNDHVPLEFLRGAESKAYASTLNLRGIQSTRTTHSFADDIPRRQREFAAQLLLRRLQQAQDDDSPPNLHERLLAEYNSQPDYQKSVALQPRPPRIKRPSSSKKSDIEVDKLEDPAINAPSRVLVDVKGNHYRLHGIPDRNSHKRDVVRNRKREEEIQQFRRRLRLELSEQQTALKTRAKEVEDSIAYSQASRTRKVGTTRVDKVELPNNPESRPVVSMPACKAHSSSVYSEPFAPRDVAVNNTVSPAVAESMRELRQYARLKDEDIDDKRNDFRQHQILEHKKTVARSNTSRPTFLSALRLDEVEEVEECKQLPLSLTEREPIERIRSPREAKQSSRRWKPTGEGRYNVPYQDLNLDSRLGGGFTKSKCASAKRRDKSSQESLGLTITNNVQKKAS